MDAWHAWMLFALGGGRLPLRVYPAAGQGAGPLALRPDTPLPPHLIRIGMHF